MNSLWVMAASHTKDASGILVYLSEELGDARLRCAQLKKLVSKAVELIAKSSHRDHFYEMAGDVIYGIPDTLFRLDKALDAVALATSKLDYEEIKQGLRPEKVDELEDVMKEVRLRYLNRQSNEELSMTPKQAAMVLDRIASGCEATGRLPTGALLRLIATLEGPNRVASEANFAGSLRRLSALLQKGKLNSRGQLASTLRVLLAENLDAGAGDEFQKVNPGISDAEADKIDEMHDKYKDTVKEKEAGVDPQSRLAAEVDEVKVENAIETTEEQLRELKHAWKVYQGNPGKNAPQLENLVTAARTIVKTLQRFIIDRVKTAGASKVGRYPRSPDELLHAMKDSVDALYFARGTFRPVHEMLGELRRDATGTTGFEDIYENADIKKVEKALYELDHTVGTVARDVEWLTKILQKKRAKTASEAVAEEAKEGRFEEGKPADPTENMSPEDAKKWREMHDKYQDTIKDKQAASGDPADLAHEILEQGLRHPALGAVSRAWEQVESALKKADTEHQNMHRHGIGSTEDVTLVMNHIVPALKSYQGTVEVVIDQLTQRLKRRSGSAARSAQVAEEAKEGRFEEGKPADPTENMSEEDAKKWEAHVDEDGSNIQKSADLSVLAALGDRDRKVVDAFIDQKGMDGKILTTDGKKLELSGMGGGVVAKWDGDLIEFGADLGSRTYDSIVRAVKKVAPKNLLKKANWCAAEIIRFL